MSACPDFDSLLIQSYWPMVYAVRFCGSLSAIADLLWSSSYSLMQLWAFTYLLWLDKLVSWALALCILLWTPTVVLLCTSDLSWTSAGLLWAPTGILWNYTVSFCWLVTMRSYYKFKNFYGFRYMSWPFLDLLWAPFSKFFPLWVRADLLWAVVDLLWCSGLSGCT